MASLHRYPVKSMLGEELDVAEVGVGGIAGDRRFALIEVETGLVASAKQARKWGRLLQCRAALCPDRSATIVLPDGSAVGSGNRDVDAVLTKFAERPVALSSSPPAEPQLERWWPDVAGRLAPPEAIEAAGTVTPMASAAPSTFFDYAPIHLVTTATLRALRSATPSLDFAFERFRPNVVVDADSDGFVENDWTGRRLVLGDVELEVLTVTPRCAVPSLAHGDLPPARDVLRTLVAANRIPVGHRGLFACAGVYAQVVTPGVVPVGHPVELVPQSH